MFFRQIADPWLAQNAYLVGCQRSREAIVVDPQRDVDRYVATARREGMRLVAAAETHIHADFLAGTRELVESRGCRAFLSAEGGPDWQYEWAQGHRAVTLLGDGDRFAVGGIEFQAAHTPGHTPEHLGYLVTDRGGGATAPMGMISGDFVFVGDLGRPDLLETAVGQSGAKDPSARRLFASARAFLDLPDYLRVWPGHGAGSACGKALGAVPDTTAGYEKRFNPALAAVGAGEDAFVDFILEDQPEAPAYFGRMKVGNRRGPPVLGRLPAPQRLSGDDLLAAAARPDSVVVDTRADRLAYYAGHIPGSIYAPLNSAFPTVTGCYVDAAGAIVLICQAGQLDTAVRALVRVGLDRVAGWAPPEALEEFAAAGGALASIEAIGFAEAGVRQNGESVRVLDVRSTAEHAAGRIDGAHNIAHTRLPARLGELDRDRTYLVHCRTGARVSAATSFLERRGYRVVAVNDVFPEA